MEVHNDTLQLFLSKKNKMAAKNWIEHNSFNFQARSYRLYMEVHNDTLQLFLSKKQNGHQKTKWPPKTKFSITQSIFKLEVPDFAW